MSLADVSIRRPTFITCIVLVMLALGTLAMQRLGVDLFPNVNFPFITITTPYPGAGPSEIETLVSKPLEDELSTLSGIRRITSVNSEGFSRVVAQFTLETDIKFAEQQVRDRVGATKSKLPTDSKEPVIRRIDPSDQPVLTLALDATLSDPEVFDIADDFIRPKLEQVNQVGLVEVIGGKKREIHVALDRNKLKSRELSVTSIFNRLKGAGENVPNGKVNLGEKEIVFRTLGEYKSIEDIRHTVVNFFGNDVPTTIGDVGTVIDTVEDETTRAFINGKKALFINIYRQSGANTIEVVDALRKRFASLNTELQNRAGKPKLTIIRDSSKWVRANVADVKESIQMGVILAVVVVFLFLGNFRSTLITGLALPNSLIGAFILMAAAGFTINIMTLLALSLSVGLLIDDAIVVRENIFRHIELGENPIAAARKGTAEVRLAVIATTLAVIAVFGPVGFLKGVVGQFFKEFGLTICFAMAISLFDALTIAPMLSAYFAGAAHEKKGKLNPFERVWDETMGRIARGFDVFQVWLEGRYEKVIRYTLKHPLIVLMLGFFVFTCSIYMIKYVPKTFLPPQDAGEFAVSIDLPPGSNLEATNEVAQKVDAVIRANKEVRITSLSVGNQTGKSEVADFYVELIPAKDRILNTIQLKAKLREQLKPFAFARPQVKDYDAIGGGQRPFNVVVIGHDQNEIEKIGTHVFEYLRKHKGLQDVDVNFRPGKPELQVVLDPTQSKALGISGPSLGMELRAQIEGLIPAKYREQGREYDVRVRLQDDQRNLKASFASTYVPNINNNLIRLPDVAKAVETAGPATINRQDRGRFVMISGDIAPGAGMGEVMTDIQKLFETTIILPQGVRYAFVGQTEDFQELMSNMMLAMGFGLLFIFLVLSSLYESFVTPFTIMLALPLAICGSFLALAATHESLNIFSMIGMIMLLGVSTKNSILLVDYAHQLIEQGMDRSSAMIKAGKTRLRPILMTTMALIAGTAPVAMGLSEVSRQRTSMGIAIIGGLISSTVLTLVVVPAAFSYIDRFRLWSKETLRRITAADPDDIKALDKELERMKKETALELSEQEA